MIPERSEFTSADSGLPIVSEGLACHYHGPGNDHLLGYSNWKVAETGLTCQYFLQDFKTAHEQLMVTLAPLQNMGI